MNSKLLDFYTREMQTIHAEALRERQALPYGRHSQGASVPFRLWSYYHHDLKPVMLQLPGITDLLRNKLRSLTSTYASVGIEAVIVTGEARRGDVPKIAAYYRWPQNMPLQYYAEQYERVLQTVGGTLANLPPQLWKDAIFNAVKGPEIGSQGILTTFEGDGQNRVVLLETTSAPNESGLIPDWWKTSIQ